MRAEEYLVSGCYLRDRIRTVVVRCAVFVCRQIGDDELMRKMRARLVARIVVGCLAACPWGHATETLLPPRIPASFNRAIFANGSGYVASDELEGRQVFTEGLGLAAGLHRGSPGGVEREARRRGRHVLPDRQGGRRAFDQQSVGHGRSERRDADVQGRRRNRVSKADGRQADDHRATRFSSSATVCRCRRRVRTTTRTSTRTEKIVIFLGHRARRRCRQVPSGSSTRVRETPSARARSRRSGPIVDGVARRGGFRRARRRLRPAVQTNRRPASAPIARAASRRRQRRLHDGRTLDALMPPALTATR